MDAGHLEGTMRPQVPRIQIWISYGLPSVSNTDNAYQPSTSADQNPTYAVRFIQMPLLWRFSQSHWKAAFPFCGPPWCFWGTTLLLLYHPCMGLNPHRVPAPRGRDGSRLYPACTNADPYSQEAVKKMSAELKWHHSPSFRSLPWSHLRYILIESKSDFGGSAYTDLTTPGKGVSEYLGDKFSITSHWFK